MPQARRAWTIIGIVVMLLLFSTSLTSAQSSDIFLPNVSGGSSSESLVHAVWEVLAVEADPLVHMPGTQPNEVALESPNRCLNCHAGYNTAVEPGFNWQGSMMAQASRDFLFWAALTVAGQDSVWKLGNPNAVDLCERCHFPKGWLEGRSDPPNASAMTGADYDGVQCDFCHSLYDPFFQAGHPDNDESPYWDETNASDTPSAAAAQVTFESDKALAASARLYSGGAFFTNGMPPTTYTENGSGQYFVSSTGEKRASFADADARHQMLYSRFHKSKYFCDSCHDVSNPVLANLAADPTQPLPTETQPAYSYGHVERTFSEFMLSAYGQPGGEATNPEFQAQGASKITHASKCQDCHMRDVVGAGADKHGVILRPDGSVEHPQSGQPLHDMTGGNAWVSYVLASAIPGSSNYDPFNDAQLNQGAAVLTLDLAQGQGIDPAALLAGVDRAKQQLLLAATIKEVTYNSGTGTLEFKVQNNSGHKLISGFPEGRRMFVNIQALDASGALLYEINPYDSEAGTLKGLPNQDTYSDPITGLPAPQPLAPNEVYVDELVYEMHPSSTFTREDETFHFVLADGRHKDNRIPPKGFQVTQQDTEEAGARKVLPVYMYAAENDVGVAYFSDAEYAGGFDAVNIVFPDGVKGAVAKVDISLYYQTTSREYIEFLRDEIKGEANTLSDPTPLGESPAYIVQNDLFFSQLKGWGDTIWNLWAHNKHIDGARPFLMAQATWGGTSACTLAAPAFTSVSPGKGEVVLSWDPAADAGGYRVYYDQGDKAQLVADVGSSTSFVDTGLTDGQTYCYKLTSYNGTCESAYSSIQCATPTNPGQAAVAGVSSLSTGVYSGKGNNTQFVATSSFAAGDSIIVRATVVDDSGSPIPNAAVDLQIAGPEVVTITTGPSDSNGVAEATWQTKSGNKKNPGTPAGDYTLTVTNVVASGYGWDGKATQTTFTIE